MTALAVPEADAEYARTLTGREGRRVLHLVPAHLRTNPVTPWTRIEDDARALGLTVYLDQEGHARYLRELRRQLAAGRYQPKHAAYEPRHAK
jgi:hypothetical protein